MVAGSGTVGSLSDKLDRKAHSGVSARLSWRLLIGLVLFGGMLVLDLFRLGQPSIWFDEAFSVELARLPFSQVWHLVTDAEPNMSLYHLLLHGWLQIMGWFGILPTEAVVRLPSALFMACSGLILYFWASRYLGLLAATVGVLLYACNFLQLTYAQQTRAYALQVLLLCLAWSALFEGLTQQKKRWWICHVLALIGAIYAHMFSWLILCGQLVGLLVMALLSQEWRERIMAQKVPLGISVLTVGVLSIPLALLIPRGAKTGWLPAPHLAEIVNLLYTIGGYQKYFLVVLALIALVGISVALLRFVSFKGRINKLYGVPGSVVPIVWALLCWFLLPIVIAYVVSLSPWRLFSARYLVTVVPPFLLLAGVGIAALRQVWLRGICLLVLLALALTGTSYYYRSAQVEDWNAATHWMQERARTEDGLVCYDNTVQQGCQIAVEYYLHAYPGPAHFEPESPGAFSWQMFGPLRSAGPDEAVDPAALQRYGQKHARIFFIVGRVRDDAASARLEQALSWMDQHFHKNAQYTSRTVSIYLYETTP
ncbi:glycosyltransferase family 39 protein [Thermosporothrix hazakensis]|nr:glycosyltransferase family 39 protein [Thermosporothrix hazakensis]BBH89280.1 hypothetical protein KTC_40310 [Thermosporothrix sp. COM3]